MLSRSYQVTPHGAKHSLTQVEKLPDCHFTDQYCKIREMWSENPLGYFQSFVRAAGSSESLYVARPIEGWRSGAEGGCILRKLVTALCQDLEPGPTFECAQEAQILVRQIREDFLTSFR